MTIKNKLLMTLMPIIIVSIIINLLIALGPKINNLLIAFGSKIINLLIAFGSGIIVHGSEIINLLIALGPIIIGFIMWAHAQSQTKANVVATIDFKSRVGLILLKIKNIGKTISKKVKITYNMKEGGKDKDDYLPFMLPGDEFVRFLCSTSELEKCKIKSISIKTGLGLKTKVCLIEYIKRIKEFGQQVFFSDEQRYYYEMANLLSNENKPKFELYEGTKEDTKYTFVKCSYPISNGATDISGNLNIFNKPYEFMCISDAEIKVSKIEEKDGIIQLTISGPKDFYLKKIVIPVKKK